LGQQGLQVAVATVPAAEQPPGTVIRQQPPAGAPVATTDVVSLEVSR
jgi:beta-lactam-binding protein with PASTA domain